MLFTTCTVQYQSLIGHLSTGLSYCDCIEPSKHIFNFSEFSFSIHELLLSSLFHSSMVTHGTNSFWQLIYYYRLYVYLLLRSCLVMKILNKSFAINYIFV